MSSNTHHSDATTVTSERPKRRAATQKAMEKMRDEIERLKQNGIDLDMSSDDEEFEQEPEDESEDSMSEADDEDDYDEDEDDE